MYLSVRTSLELSCYFKSHETVNRLKTVLVIFMSLLDSQWQPEDGMVCCQISSSMHLFHVG